MDWAVAQTQAMIHLRPVNAPGVQIPSGVQGQFGLAITEPLPVADVVVILTARPVDGDPIAGFARCWTTDQWGRCVVGHVNLVPGAFDPDDAEARPLVLSAQRQTALHELIHVLGGMAPSPVFRDYATGAMAPASDVWTTLDRVVGTRTIPVTYIKTPKVLGLARAHFGCDSLPGLPLEDQPLGRGSHWEARVLGPEVMSYGAGAGETILSSFTLAFLEDTHQYHVPDYEAAPRRMVEAAPNPPGGDSQSGLFGFLFPVTAALEAQAAGEAVLATRTVQQQTGVWGKGEGCPFVMGRPRDDWPKNYLCTENGQLGCSADRKQRAVCVIRSDWSLDATGTVSCGAWSDSVRDATCSGALNDACAGGFCNIPSWMRTYDTDEDAADATGIRSALAIRTGGYSSAMDFATVNLGFWSCQDPGDATGAVAGTGSGNNSLVAAGSGGSSAQASSAGFAHGARRLQVDLASQAADEAAARLGGQEQCESCRCFDSSLSEFSEGLTGSAAAGIAGGLVGLCYRTHCVSPTRLQVSVRSSLNGAGAWYACPEEGGNLAIAGFTGTLRCPPAAEVCGDSVATDKAFPETLVWVEWLVWSLLISVPLLCLIICAIAPSCRNFTTRQFKICCGVSLFAALAPLDPRDRFAILKDIVDLGREEFDIAADLKGKAAREMIALRIEEKRFGVAVTPSAARGKRGSTGGIGDRMIAPASEGLGRSSLVASRWRKAGLAAKVVGALDRDGKQRQADKQDAQARAEKLMAMKRKRRRSAWAQAFLQSSRSVLAAAMELETSTKSRTAAAGAAAVAAAARKDGAESNEPKLNTKGRRVMPGMFSKPAAAAGGAGGASGAATDVGPRGRRFSAPNASDSMRDALRAGGEGSVLDDPSVRSSATDNRTGFAPDSKVAPFGPGRSSRPPLTITSKPSRSASPGQPLTPPAGSRRSSATPRTGTGVAAAGGRAVGRARFGGGAAGRGGGGGAGASQAAASSMLRTRHDMRNKRASAPHTAMERTAGAAGLGTGAMRRDLGRGDGTAAAAAAARSPNKAITLARKRAKGWLMLREGLIRASQMEAVESDRPGLPGGRASGGASAGAASKPQAGKGNARPGARGLFRGRGAKEAPTGGRPASGGLRGRAGADADGARARRFSAMPSISGKGAGVGSLTEDDERRRKRLGQIESLLGAKKSDSLQEAKQESGAPSKQVKRRNKGRGMILLQKDASWCLWVVGLLQVLAGIGIGTVAGVLGAGGSLSSLPVLLVSGWTLGLGVMGLVSSRSRGEVASCVAILFFYGSVVTLGAIALTALWIGGLQVTLGAFVLRNWALFTTLLPAAFFPEPTAAEIAAMANTTLLNGAARSEAVSAALFASQVQQLWFIPVGGAAVVILLLMLGAFALARLVSCHTLSGTLVLVPSYLLVLTSPILVVIGIVSIAPRSATVGFDFILSVGLISCGLAGLVHGILGLITGICKFRGMGWAVTGCGVISVGLSSLVFVCIRNNLLGSSATVAKATVEQLQLLAEGTGISAQDPATAEAVLKSPGVQATFSQALQDSYRALASIVVGLAMVQLVLSVAGVLFTRSMSAMRKLLSPAGLRKARAMANASNALDRMLNGQTYKFEEETNPGNRVGISLLAPFRRGKVKTEEQAQAEARAERIKLMVGGAKRILEGRARADIAAAADEDGTLKAGQAAAASRMEDLEAIGIDDAKLPLPVRKPKRLGAAGGRGSADRARPAWLESNDDERDGAVSTAGVIGHMGARSASSQVTPRGGMPATPRDVQADVSGTVATVALLDAKQSPAAEAPPAAARSTPRSRRGRDKGTSKSRPPPPRKARTPSESGSMGQSSSRGSSSFLDTRPRGQSYGASPPSSAEAAVRVAMTGSAGGESGGSGRRRGRDGKPPHAVSTTGKVGSAPGSRGSHGSYGSMAGTDLAFSNAGSATDSSDSDVPDSLDKPARKPEVRGRGVRRGGKTREEEGRRKQRGAGLTVRVASKGKGSARAAERVRRRRERDESEEEEDEDEDDQEPLLASRSDGGSKDSASPSRAVAAAFDGDEESASEDEDEDEDPAAVERGESARLTSKRGGHSKAASSRSRRHRSEDDDEEEDGYRRGDGRGRSSDRRERSSGRRREEHEREDEEDRRGSRRTGADRSRSRPRGDAGRHGSNATDIVEGALRDGGRRGRDASSHSKTPREAGGGRGSSRRREAEPSREPKRAADPEPRSDRARRHQEPQKSGRSRGAKAKAGARAGSSKAKGKARAKSKTRPRPRMRE